MNTLVKNEEIINGLKNGDNLKRDEFITNNMKLVYSLARRFSQRNVEYDDLVQIGCIGLIKAAKSFDHTYNVKFSTYAVPMILGEIKRYFRDNTLVKTSRSVKEIAVKAKLEAERFFKENGREASVSELSKILNISKEELSFYLEAVSYPKSLDEEIGDGDFSLADTIYEASKEDIIINNISLCNALKKLPEKERKVIELRFFCEFTQSKTANILNISQVTISRTEKRALIKLRQLLDDGTKI